MNRREFLKLASAVSAVPLFNIGCASAMKPIAERKIRLGLIGCGGRMGLNTNYGILNNMCDEEIVCIAEPDTIRWQKVLAVVKHHQSDTNVFAIKCFRDYHEMLDKMAGELDAVVIATPNHHHACAAILAMKKGLHVYVEKPMAMTIEEVEAMAKVQKEMGVVAQVGNHGHSEEGMRRLVEYVHSGALGQIREVYCFNDRINGCEEKPKDCAAPESLDWNSWLGPAEKIPYREGLHPHDWHSWIGFGNGSIGNMGTHIMDPVFWALKLGEVNPSTIALTDMRSGCEGSWGLRHTIRYDYPERKGMDRVSVWWYDGIKDNVKVGKTWQDGIGVCKKREYQNLPPIVEELEKKYGVELGQLGSVFMCEKGCVNIGPHGGGLQFMPRDLRRHIPKPPKTIPREKGMNHQQDWLRAIRKPNRPCGCNFEYSAPLAKAVLLGNVVARAGVGEYKWDGCKITNLSHANPFLKATYRKGWELQV